MLEVQFADITEGVDHITEFDIDFMLRILDHITVCESGNLLFTFMDGIDECNGEYVHPSFTTHIKANK